MARTPVQQSRETVVPTKARILATAEEVFAAKGFEGASTREIAAKAGVNISSLHYHWDSKERLYVAVFQDILDRIVALVRTVGRPAVNEETSVEDVIETAMGRLFDFFCDHPTVPKLLLRRLMEENETHVEVERDVLMPAWKVFAEWTQHYRGRAMSEQESALFMLTSHSIMLLFLLDSLEFQRLLGGSVRLPENRKRVRAHIIRVVQRLL